MKEEIEKKLPSHLLVPSNAKEIYIVDYKNLNLGKVELKEKLPEDIKYVFLDNSLQEIGVYFDGFSENALEISLGLYSSQCECGIFPIACNDNDWVLFIETKYTNDLISAFKKENNYPNCMVKQIVSTVQFFRNKGILDKKRRVNAIVSFPNLIEEFNSTFFSGELNILDILKEHNILIRATNSAKIISNKRIELNSI